MRSLPVALLVFACMLASCAGGARAPRDSRPTALHEETSRDAGGDASTVATMDAESRPTGPAGPSIDPAPLLAKHRAAVGGDAAIAAASRLRVRQKTLDTGLEGTETYVIDGARHRSDSKIPALGADAIEVWNGKQLVVRGWNGDVRTQGANSRRRAITSISLHSLGYLRDPATPIRALPAQDEGGTHFDRLLVTPSGGEPVEIWLRPDGLAAKWIFPERKKTYTIDAYLKQGSVLFPKVVSKQDPMLKEPDRETVESVELLGAPLPESLFERPLPKGDVVFPKGTSKIVMPAGLLHGRFLSVTGSLGGRRGTFLLDTGASMTVMDDDFLSEGGIRFVGGASFATAAVFKGVRFARVPELDVNGIKVGSQVVLAIPLRKSPDFPLPVDGVLGYDFWSRFVTSVDYPVGTLTFQKAGTYVPQGSDVAIPFELEGTVLEVPVTINGKNAGTFKLDTGNGDECTIHRFDGVEAIVPRGPNPLRFARSIVYGSSAAAGYETSVDIGIGPFVYKSAPVSLIDPKDPAGASTHGNGNIGLGFLKSFVVTFDYGKSTVYLRQVRPFRPASTVGVTGILVKPTKDGPVISEVIAGWPGEKAGLHVGDAVLAIDGVPVTSAGTNDIGPGEARTYRVRRGDSTLDLTLRAAPHP